MPKGSMSANEIYKWLIMPKAYFLCAEVTRKKLLNMLSTPKNFRSVDSFTDTIPSFHELPEYTVLPIVYNLKHGIELYLKALEIMYKEKYDMRHESTERIKTIINDLKIMPGVDLTIIEELEQIENKVKKYYNGSWIPIKTTGINDRSNTAERYPEGNNYEIPEFIDVEMNRWVTPELLEEIGKDLQYLVVNLRKVIIQIHKIVNE